MKPERPDSPQTGATPSERCYSRYTADSDTPIPASIWTQSLLPLDQRLKDETNFHFWSASMSLILARLWHYCSAHNTPKTLANWNVALIVRNNCAANSKASELIRDMTDCTCMMRALEDMYTRPKRNVLSKVHPLRCSLNVTKPDKLTSDEKTVSPREPLWGEACLARR